MSAKTRSCLVCHGETHPGRIETVGEEKSIAVNLHEMPVLECANGHRQFVNPEFPLPLLDRLLAEQSRLPAGQARRKLLVKHFYCHACGAELEGSPGARRTLHVDVELQGAPPFDADVSVAVYRCVQCGDEQVRSTDDVSAYMPVALANAFRAAGIAHG